MRDDLLAVLVVLAARAKLGQRTDLSGIDDLWGCSVGTQLPRALRGCSVFVLQHLGAVARHLNPADRGRSITLA